MPASIRRPHPAALSPSAAAIESFTGAPFGSPGTETASGIITRAVKAVPVKQTGYSGLMIPVLEDSVLTRRWTEGTYGLDSILAYSAVCAGGVDTVPLAGDTSEEAIARIVGDVATLAFKWNKPLATRLLPAPGKKVGRDDGVQRRTGERRHPTADRLATALERVSMKLACSSDELEQLLNDVAFTRNFGFTLLDIADGQCASMCPFRTNLSARAVSSAAKCSWLPRTLRCGWQSKPS